MHWLLAERNKDIPQHKQLNENLIKFGVSHSFCDVRMFAGTIEEMGIDLSGITETIFPFGSYSLAKALKNSERSKAVFMSDNINLSILHDNWGAEMLNSDAVYGTLGELEPISDEFFCRPNEDTKSFNTGIWTARDYKAYQQKIVEQQYDPLYPTVNADTMIVMASPKIVQSEYRFFIVDKQIAGQAQYRRNGEPYMNGFVGEYISDYVSTIISGWNPELVYVLDVAVTDGVCKILEVNGVHASGMYAIDTQRFINAVESLGL